MKAIFPILLSLLFGLNALAAPPLPSSHGHEWARVIDALTAKGLNRVGSFDLPSFRRTAARVHWWQLQGSPASEKSGSRETAFYERGKFNVYIDEALPAAALASLPELELHEAMGAIGEDDTNYQKSTALFILSELPPGAKHDALVARYAKTIFSGREQVALLDGGTGVSGGGDLPAVFLKDSVLKRILNEDGNVSGDFLALYPEIRFEPLRAGVSAHVSMKYTVSIQPSPSEALSIFIPMMRWKQGAKAQNALLDDTAQRIVEIFPAHGGATRTFQPSECSRPNQTVTFPATHDADVAAIQDFRGGILLGCRKLMPNEDNINFTVSREQGIQEPRAAGFHYFQCEFLYKGSRFARTAKIFPQPRNLWSLTWSIQSGDFLSGDMETNQDGRIVSTNIDYHPPEGKLVLRRPNPSASGAEGESHVTLLGHDLTFRCTAQVGE